MNYDREVVFMFFSLFLSKNQKQVRQWKEEHREIVALATALLNSYDKGEKEDLKNILEELRVITFNHLMSEDAEFYRLLEEYKNKDSKTELFIKEFEESFYGTKAALMHFLDDYTKKSLPIDDTFIKRFNELVDILLKRIEFEESNLYSLLESQ